jgi:hypothetical protein
MVDLNLKPERRLRSGQWRAIAALIAMVAALAVVWAVIASFSLMQRNSDLEKATQELMDAREDLDRLRAEQAEPQTDLLPLDDYTP